MDYTVEKTWENYGYSCVVIMSSMGYRCGYVGIKKDHPLYKFRYDEEYNALKKLHEEIKDHKYDFAKYGIIQHLSGKTRPISILQVHGGITYSEGDSEYPVPNDGIWWFGYDCGHGGDAKDLSVVPERVKQIELKYPCGGILRSLDYCIQECNELAKQLNFIKKYLKGN